MPMPRSGKPQRFWLAGMRVMGWVKERPGDLARSPGSNDESYAAFLATGTAQPPLPLQEFLPAQPESPVLQPPWPLQEFMPLQECFMSAEAHPPLPLQEFLPAQPASPLLQPPLPLQEFLPAHTCLSEAALSSLAFSSPAVVFALPLLAGVIAVARPEPASTPAIARPIALVVRSPF